MPKFLVDILKMLWVMVLAMVAVEQPDSGVQKRSQVVTQMEKIMDEPGGIDWPSYLPKDFRAWMLGFAVDALTGLLNKTGFFNK